MTAHVRTILDAQKVRRQNRDPTLDKQATNHYNIHMNTLINYPEWGKKMGPFVSRKTHEFELYKQRVRNEMSELMDKIWELEAKIEKLEDKINTIKEK